MAVVDPTDLQNDLDIDREVEIIETEDLSLPPVKLELRSTQTTNPSRPRTIAAGYDGNTRTITVVFRDETWYNYYDVPSDMWDQFKQAPSKGVYLRESGLDYWHSRGEANREGLSSRSLAQYDSIVKASRRKQIMTAGGQYEGNPRSKLWDLTKLRWNMQTEDYS